MRGNRPGGRAPEGAREIHDQVAVLGRAFDHAQDLLRSVVGYAQGDNARRVAEADAIDEDRDELPLGHGTTIRGIEILLGGAL